MSTTPDTPDEPTQRIVIDVDRDGWTQGLQLNIAQLDENGSGHGYRLAGPKYNGSSKNLLRRTLDERDAREIRQYLDAVFPMPPAAKAKEQPCSGGAAIDHDETGVCNHGPGGEQPAAPVLSDSVRQFLTFALNCAAEEMDDRCDEFDDADEAALKALRRIATGAPAEQHQPGMDRLGRIAEAHSKNQTGGGMTSGDCDECGHAWPCPTYVWATTDRDPLATWDPADEEQGR